MSMHRTVFAPLVLLLLALAAPRGFAQTFTYDAAGRLTRATYPGGATVSYTFDASGNITKQATTAQPPSSSGGGGGGGGCFIATAAYGSPLDAHVESLREFRERRLRTNAPGRAFIRFYERASPPIAAFIAERAWARAATRIALTPIVFGIEHPLTTLFACFALAAFVLWRRRQRKNVTAIL